MEVEKVRPYSPDGEKGAQVEEMFDSIAPAYDFMNTAMSFGLHRYWRNTALKKAMENLRDIKTPIILDVATGTGDIVFYLHKKLPEARITGIDLSLGMLEVARKKLEKLPLQTSEQLAFGKADCLSLPYPDENFDLVSVAYGVRNFSDLEKGLKEMNRVMKKGGTICIIELSTPQGKVSGSMYRFYSGKVIPFLGKKVSGDKRAYTYLPESIAACPQRNEMSKLMEESGFVEIIWKSLSFGAVTYYIAKKL